MCVFVCLCLCDCLDECVSFCTSWGSRGAPGQPACVCVHPAQPTRRLWLCAAGWVKSPSGPQGIGILSWVFTQSGRSVAALPPPTLPCPSLPCPAPAPFHHLRCNCFLSFNFFALQFKIYAFHFSLHSSSLRCCSSAQATYTD